MAKVRLSLTFYGARAEKHRVSAARVADVIKNLNEDLTEACQMTRRRSIGAPVECYLYLVGHARASSLSLRLEGESLHSTAIAVASRKYIEGLSDLKKFAGNGFVPPGMSVDMLERVRRNCGPIAEEYEGIRLEIMGVRRPVRVMLDKELRLTLERKISQIAKVAEKPKVHSVQYYDVEGLMYALEDENYDDPNASVTVKVDAGEHSNWVCRVKRSLLPGDLASHWRERVQVRGTAKFSQRKQEMEVEQVKLLGRHGSLTEAVKKFIATNEALWQGEDTTAYMDEIRERR